MINNCNGIFSHKTCLHAMNNPATTRKLACIAGGFFLCVFFDFLPPTPLSLFVLPRFIVVILFSQTKIKTHPKYLSLHRLQELFMVLTTNVCVRVVKDIHFRLCIPTLNCNKSACIKHTGKKLRRIQYSEHSVYSGSLALKMS